MQLEVARKYGADVVLNPTECDVVEKVRSLTGGFGCDVYIEATGHPQSVKHGQVIPLLHTNCWAVRGGVDSLQVEKRSLLGSIIQYSDVISSKCREI